MHSAELTLVILASQVRVPVQASATLLLILVPLNAPGKAVENGLTLLGPLTSMWEIRMGSLGPVFSLVQS